MKKKILSIILAISMIVSLVPTISASAAEETPYQLVYDFRNIDGYSGNVIEDLNDITYAKTEGTWAFDSSSGDNVEHKVNYGIEIKSNNVGDYFAVKINVPYDGDYVPTLKYMDFNSKDDEVYSKADVYILPEGTDVSTAADSDKKIIAEDLYVNRNGGANDGSSKFDDLAEYTQDGSIRLSAGENILVFYLTETTTSRDYARMRPGALTLTSGTPAEEDSYATVPMYMEVVADATELKVGDSTDLTVSGWLNDGTVLGDALVSFKSKAGYVSVENGVVTAKETGTDVITATVTYGGKTLSKDISIAVLPEVSAPPYQLVYDFSNLDESGYTSDNKATLIYDKVVFGATNGTWAYHSRHDLMDDTVTYKPNYGMEIKSNGVGDYFAVKINVPYEGDFVPSLTYYEQDTKDDAKYVVADVYILPENSDVSTAAEDNKKFIVHNLYFNRNGGKNSPTNLAKYEKDTSIKLSAGENILVFYVTDCGGDHNYTRVRPGALTLTSGTLADGESYATVPMYISEAKANDAELETGDSTTIEISGWMNDGTAFDKNSNTVSFDTESENISIDGNTVTASSVGTATVTASVTSGEKTLAKDIDIAVVPTAQEKADAAFNAAEATTQYNAPELTGLTIGGKVINGVPNGDGSFNITAPAAKENGSKFLYWAKGLATQKTILLYKTNELKNYFPGENGRELLIAVYEDELPVDAEYYNANGQLIPDAKDSDRPYMAGYGTASGWKQYGETNIRVAEYNNKTQPDNVTVTVVNGTGTATLPYGEKVTCTANEAEEGTYFRWWQKDVNGVPEIVSVDKEYSFLAYENCTVTAVYGDTAVNVTNPAKIIIDTFGENSVMAEFIGFGSNVVEKGIMWNNNKIAMTAPGNQFTVTADKNGTFKGYAIVKDGDAYTLITDGEVTISNAE
ncbi:MAG: hypothetical protein E7441_00120 [Ruminococcaceae bacterium]|nr:hypothetical protein [Oscillospiraceae bacterium]